MATVYEEGIDRNKSQTIRQRAYHLINDLSDDSVSAIIEVMLRMKPSIQYKDAKNGTENEKIEAYNKMQELRKKLSVYDISVEQRAKALEEKYGSVEWMGVSN